MGEQTESSGEDGNDSPSISESEADEIVERYRALVYKIAHRLRNNLPEQIPLEDLVAWGFTGLLEAYRRYDERQSSRFGTFAYYRIRGAILDGCPDPLLDPTRRKVDVGCNEVLNTYAHVVQSHEGQASIEDRLSMLSDVTGSLLMIYVLADSPDRALRSEAAPHHQNMTRRQDIQKVRDALQKLDDNEQEVLKGVYFREDTLAEIAERLDLSTSWVCRLHTRAVSRLREVIENDAEFEDLRHAIPV